MLCYPEPFPSLLHHMVPGVDCACSSLFTSVRPAPLLKKKMTSSIKFSRLGNVKLQKLFLEPLAVFVQLNNLYSGAEMKGNVDYQKKNLQDVMYNLYSERTFCAYQS